MRLSRETRWKRFQLPMTPDLGQHLGQHGVALSLVTPLVAFGAGVTIPGLESLYGCRGAAAPP